MSDTGDTQTVEKTVTPRRERNITFVDTPTSIPPLVKESMYPWDRLASGAPLANSFFVECDDKDDAKTSIASIRASGKNYYEKRDIALRPIARVFPDYEVNGEKKIGVMVWAAPADEADDEETTGEE